MPADGLAIVAGRGDLPRLIAEDCARRGRTYRVVAFDGVPLDWTEGHPVLRAAFDRLGTPTEASRVLTAHSDVRCS